MALDFATFQVYAPQVTIIDGTEFTALLPKAVALHARVAAPLKSCNTLDVEYSENAVFALMIYLKAIEVTDSSIQASTTASGGLYTSRYKVDDEEYSQSQLSSQAAINAQLAQAKTPSDLYNIATAHLGNAGCTLPQPYKVLTV